MRKEKYHIYLSDEDLKRVVVYEHLRKDNSKLANENKKLVTQNRDYNLLRKVFGSKQIDELLAKAKEPKQSKQRDERFRKNKDYER